MQISGTGALVAAFAGAVLRATVVLYHTGGQMPMLALPSAGIGLLVGGIAGASGRPLRGAAIGAILSGLIFELFLLSCASVFGTAATLLGDAGAGGRLHSGALPYLAQMALAGAVAGALGGAAGRGDRGGVGKGPADPSRDV